MKEPARLWVREFSVAGQVIVSWVEEVPKGYVIVVTRGTHTSSALVPLRAVESSLPDEEGLPGVLSFTRVMMESLEQTIVRTQEALK